MGGERKVKKWVEMGEMVKLEKGSEGKGGKRGGVRRKVDIVKEKLGEERVLSGIGNGIKEGGSEVEVYGGKGWRGGYERSEGLVEVMGVRGMRMEGGW